MKQKCRSRNKQQWRYPAAICWLYEYRKENTERDEVDN